MIGRDVGATSSREFDLVIIGGGIHGVALLHEAARRGIAACLCEARDFGGATSLNSLRILHGGLRHLQTLDLPRFFDSVAARRRWAQLFPDLIRPLTCLMPLYGGSFRGRSLLRVALLANDVLSLRRNTHVPAALQIPRGTIEDAHRVGQEFPLVRSEGLKGGACWTDYLMVSSERVLIELLRDACRRGAVAFNYLPVEDVIHERGAAKGVRVRDTLSGAVHSIAARAIVNCAGAGLPQLARCLGGRVEGLFQPSLAFNVLLDRAPPSRHALAVAAPDAGAPVMFLVPMRGRVLAGTMHVARSMAELDAGPTEAELARFIRLLNAAVPGLAARLDDVRRIFSGFLPARKAGSAELERKVKVLDHGRSGGLRGSFSVAGVKFTTATSAASHVLDLICGPRRHAQPSVPAIELSASTPLLIDSRRLWDDDAQLLRDRLRRVVEEESVHGVEDLVLRRTNWATTDVDPRGLRARLETLIDLPDRSGQGGATKGPGQIRDARVD